MIYNTQLKILNGTPKGVPSRTSMATLPINELKKAGIYDACPILNLHRRKTRHRRYHSRGSRSSGGSSTRRRQRLFSDEDLLPHNESAAHPEWITDSPPISRQSMNVLRGSWKAICKIASATADAILSSQHLHLKTQELSKKTFTQISKSHMYAHIPAEIREHISATEWTGLEQEGVLQGGRKFKIWLAVPKHRIPSSQLHRYLHYVVVWLQFASTIARQSCAEELKIHLILSDAKKRAPLDGEGVVDEIHANTAFTTSCSKHNEIFLYRREEWFKVFLHETFHCLGLDFSAMSRGPRGDPTNECILSHFPVLDPNTDVRLYETFCEVWAELFHLMFRLWTDRRSGKCRAFSEKQFTRELQLEQTFSIYQSNKILRLSNLEYSDLFSKKDERMVYRENTQAFSYYVLKSVLLWHVDAFIQWCIRHCSGELAPLQFIESHVESYCGLVLRLAKTTHYGVAHAKTTHYGVAHAKTTHYGVAHAKTTHYGVAHAKTTPEKTEDYNDETTLRMTLKSLE